METLQSLLLDLRQAVESGKSSIWIYAAVFAVIGLAIGILLVWLGRRWNLFQRSSAAWTALARINYVLLPLLFLGLGACLGGVFGAKSATDSFISKNSSTIGQYSFEYFSGFQKYVRESLSSSSDKNLSVSQAVARHLSTDPAIESGSVLQRAAFELNSAAVQQGLKSLMRTGMQKDSLELLRKADLSKMTAGTFVSVPRMLLLRSSMFFFDYYTRILGLFGLLLLIPVLEFGGYQLYRQFGSKPSNRQMPAQSVAAPMQQRTAPAAELTYNVPPVSSFVSPPVQPMEPEHPPVIPAPPELSVAEPAAVPEPVHSTEAPAPVVEAPLAVTEEPTAQEVPEVPQPAVEEPVLPAEALQSPVEAEAPAPAPPSLTAEPDPVVVPAPQPEAAITPPVPPPPSPLDAQAPLREAAPASATMPAASGLTDNGQRTAVRAVTFILCGALLQLMYGVTDDFSAELVALIGLGLFFVGLGLLESVLDFTGRSGVKLLKIGTIVGIIGGVIGLIPAVGGLLAALPSAAAFVLQLLGLLRLKNSASFGMTAQNGFTMQLIGLGLAIPAAIISAFPFGSIIGGFIYIGVLMLFLYGWLQVQKELLYEPHLDGRQAAAARASVPFYTPPVAATRQPSQQQQPRPVEMPPAAEPFQAPAREPAPGFSTTPTGTSATGVAPSGPGGAGNFQMPDFRNPRTRRSIIPGLFGLTMLFFFFTFCEFSCQGNRLAQVTGIELVTGTTIDAPKDMASGPMGGGIFGPAPDESKRESKSLNPNPWAVLAFAGALAGLILFLIGNRLENLVGMIAGAAGAVSLLILKMTVQSAVQKETNGFIRVDFTFGYWMAVLALLAAGVLCFLRWQELNKPPTLGAMGG